jgi:hypothetical protein
MRMSAPSKSGISGDGEEAEDPVGQRLRRLGVDADGDQVRCPDHPGGAVGTSSGTTGLPAVVSDLDRGEARPDHSCRVGPAAVS